MRNQFRMRNRQAVPLPRLGPEKTAELIFMAVQRAMRIFTYHIGMLIVSLKDNINFFSRQAVYLRIRHPFCRYKSGI